LFDCLLAATAFRAKAGLAAPNAIPTSPVRFHETAAAMKAVRVVTGRFHAAERSRVAVAKTDAHCAMVRTHAAARIRVLVADRTGAAIRCAMVTHCAKELRCVMEGQRGLAIRFAMGDPCFGLALASNAVNHQPHAMGCCDLPANDFRRSTGASGQEFSRPVDSPSNAKACRCE
jgi:hypothetical protein